MFRESLHRLADPRLRWPITGVVVSYLTWALLLEMVIRLGWADGSSGERVLAASLPMLPILALLGFMVRLHLYGDEVERSMHLAAAATGFGAMLLAALFAMHLETVVAPLQMTATHIFSLGMLAWLFGLLKAFSSYR